MTDLQKIDHELVIEERRHSALARAADDDYEIDQRDVHVPTAALKALQARVRRYQKLVESTFDKGFSIDDIGDAGSLDLRMYSRLYDKSPSWEDMLLPEDDFMTNPEVFAESIAERALNPS
jgi:hypothetical protein